MSPLYAPRVSRADNLVTEITAILAASDLEHTDLVRVSIDENDIDKTTHQQHGVIIVLPGPRITYPAPGLGVKQLEWKVLIVCKAGSDPRQSFLRLDSLLAVLEDALEISEAVPGNLVRDSGQSKLPGYTLTIPDSYQN